MADTDLAATGKDTSVTVTYDGVVIGVYEVTRERARAVIDEIETKPLGKTTVSHDEIVVGWELSLDIEVSRKGLDELIDLMIAASRARLPGIIAVSIKTRYRNLANKTYTYLDCKASAYEVGGGRGEARKATLTLKTGQDRVAS